ncbi:flippase-like domain-containing protein [Halovenus sp. WSH3]|uniref:Flippase-like domain-containing protein n=1 Tax=Halovenus carboxidivorans TaxID=2692199 RepID=A0A6B0T8Q3_9EURY|nr:lysylphosphatidylglycerol synthase transmembrane domain-containing protein [Halovenus carboxidivorans]MXR51712.1 flippase-like domain-containing protein [Halovenus carboxidivorans]
MDRRRALLISASGTAVIFAVLLFVVGGRKVLTALRSADPQLVGLVVVAGAGWLSCWGLMLRSILGTLGTPITVLRSLQIYVAVAFANNVTPFGQAGGEPVAAFLISKVTDEPYETGLAGISAVDVLNVVSSVTLILVSVSYYATTTTVAEAVEDAVLSAIGIIVGVGIVLGVGWRYRWSLVSAASRVAAFTASRLVPSSGLDLQIQDRAARFFNHVETIATSPSRLALVLGLSLAGWVLQGVALFIAFQAVGQTVPVAVVLFAVPLGNLAGAAPLPGGLGGIEAAFVAILVPTTGIPAATVTAAVLIHRGVVYWLPVLVGGTVAARFGMSLGRT